MITIEQVRVLDAVVDKGSFRAASEALFKSQPALTVAIKKLEESVGFDIFDKEAYRARLTPKGEAFYRQAKTLLKCAEGLKSYAEHLQSVVEADIGISLDCFLPLESVLPLFSNLMREYPHTHFRFYTENMGGGMERLSLDSAEVAITENLNDHVQNEAIPLFTMQMLAVASPDYFAVNESLLSNPQDILDTLQIVLKDSSQRNYEFGVVSARNWTVTSNEVRYKLILDGLGWGRLPKYLVEKDIQTGRLVRLNYPHTETRYLTLSLIRKRLPCYGVLATKLFEGLKAIDFSAFHDGV